MKTACKFGTYFTLFLIIYDKLCALSEKNSAKFDFLFRMGYNLLEIIPNKQ